MGAGVQVAGPAPAALLGTLAGRWTERGTAVSPTEVPAPQVVGLACHDAAPIGYSRGMEEQAANGRNGHLSGSFVTRSQADRLSRKPQTCFPTEVTNRQGRWAPEHTKPAPCSNLVSKTRQQQRGGGPAGDLGGSLCYLRTQWLLAALPTGVLRLWFNRSGNPAGPGFSFLQPLSSSSCLGVFSHFL